MSLHQLYCIFLAHYEHSIDLLVVVERRSNGRAHAEIRLVPVVERVRMAASAILDPLSRFDNGRNGDVSLGSASDHAPTSCIEQPLRWILTSFWELAVPETIVPGVTALGTWVRWRRAWTNAAA